MKKDKYYYRRGGIIGFALKLGFAIIVLGIAFGMISLYFNKNSERWEDTKTFIENLGDIISDAGTKAKNNNEPVEGTSPNTAVPEKDVAPLVE